MQIFGKFILSLIILAFSTQICNAAPEERRSPEVRKYLSASVKISVSWASGSGTIVYYDRKTGYAYVATCGHLWGGSRDLPKGSAVLVKKRRRDGGGGQILQGTPVDLNPKIIVWYKNDEKLDKPLAYPAEILFWSNQSAHDSALMRFKPDWEPRYFALASTNYNYSGHFHSTGCDGGKEVADYDVIFKSLDDWDLSTDKNRVRPGRSGGGLLSEDGFLVGTCWGYVNNDGEVSKFTPLSHILDVFKRNNYEWLFNVPRYAQAREIKINGKYTKNDIPIPTRGSYALPR